GGSRTAMVRGSGAGPAGLRRGRGRGRRRPGRARSAGRGALGSGRIRRTRARSAWYGTPAAGGSLCRGLRCPSGRGRTCRVAPTSTPDGGAGSRGGRTRRARRSPTGTDHPACSSRRGERPHRCGERRERRSLGEAIRRYGKGPGRSRRPGLRSGRIVPLRPRHFARTEIVTMLTATGLDVRAGSAILLQDASFRIAPGDKIGLVGRNGAGKTTLTRILAGEAQAT